MGNSFCNCNGYAEKDPNILWKSIGLRKISFDSYKKITDRNLRKWLQSGDKKISVDLRKCEELFPLLNSVDFSEKERKIFFDSLNQFVNELTDKVTFFTALSFFTRLDSGKNLLKEKEKLKEKEDEREKDNSNLINFLNKGELKNLSDVVNEILLRMAIKRNNHDEVTKLFLELVAEFPLDYLYSNDRKIFEEKSLIYSGENREKLFYQLKFMNGNKFYEYMFNDENVSFILNDLEKIYLTSNGPGITEV